MAPLSEYRRKFKQKGEACQQDYVNRYEYMVSRRSTEMRHTPIDWDVPSDTDSEISSARSEVIIKPKVKARKVKILQQDAKDKGDLPVSADGPNKDKPNIEVNDAAIQVGRGEINSRLDRQKTKDKCNCKCLKHGKSKPKSKDAKAEKDGKSQGEAKPRPKSEMKTRPPLIPYGWAYRGPIDSHKTFNVQVPEACPSALRALKRRQLDIQRKEEEKKREGLQKKRTEALFNFIEKDQNGWMSEYQRNFSGNKIRY